MQGDVRDNFPLQRETLQKLCQPKYDVENVYKDHYLLYMLEPGNGVTE